MMAKEIAKENVLSVRISSEMKHREMTMNKEYPEHLRQLADLVSAILRRIKDKRLDEPDMPCIHIAEQKGAAAI